MAGVRSNSRLSSIRSSSIGGGGGTAIVTITYERDVAVLNHCFDDIEKFISRLQHAAAAARELERRQANRSKTSSKKKSSMPGDGLLTMRTKPPYVKEFIDIFAKFKLSFNLLAKLKSHIHDPNAPELIHFLFTPLALIVDASHDSYYTPPIAGQVIDPLLTREAINLLVNCVTSKETELWRSLGDAWTVPRDQWKTQAIGSYHPVFFDGWSPDYPVNDELDDDDDNDDEHTIVMTTSKGTHAAGSTTVVTGGSIVGSSIIGGGGGSGKPRTMVDHHQPYEYDTRYNPPASPGLRETISASRSDISRTSELSAGVVHAWVENVRARGGRVVQGTHPRTANNDKELSVVRGEFLEVLDDSRKWWKCRNVYGQVGHVPHTIVQPLYGHGHGGEHVVTNNLPQITNYGRTNAR